MKGNAETREGNERKIGTERERVNKMRKGKGEGGKEIQETIRREGGVSR